MKWVTRQRIQVNRTATAWLFRGQLPMTRRAALALALSTAALLSACKRPGREVVVYTSVDQVFSEPIFRDFEKRSGIRVLAVFDTEETKSTGVLNRLIAEANNPRADIFWSGDPVRPYLLAKRGLVEIYEPKAAADLAAQFKGQGGTWTGAAARARVLLVNTTLVSPAEMPRSIRDLASPRWKGRTAIASPLFGTTTMHVAALFAVWGEERAKAFLNELKANKTRIASSNGEVKRLVSSGEVAFGLADSDDAAEALHDKAPIAVVHPDQDDLGTLVMPTAVVVLKGPHPAAARALAEHLASPEVEQRLSADGGHLSLRKARDLRAMKVDYARVAEEMERIQPWLRQWAGL